nr:LysR family transcriptional regulator [Photobacterium galatheae]
MRSFHAGYTCLSFKQAAALLKIPTSNVSRHVVQLEEKMGTRLLQRTTRRMSPTEAGHQLYASTSPLMIALNDALEDISQHAQRVAGQLKVLMPDIPALADVLVTFSQAYPKVSICCETSLNPKEDLRNGFDLVFSFHRGTLEDSGWVAKEVARWPSCIVGSPDLIARCGLPATMDDLRQMPCITSLTALNGMPWIFQGSKGRPQAMPVSSSFKANSGNIAIRAALAGLGFAILAEAGCREALAAGQLEKITLEAEPEDLVLYAFYAGRKHLPQKIHAFLTHLDSHLKL